MPYSRPSLLISVVAAVVLLACPGAAQEQTGSIEGMVRDPQGLPLAGASVRAKSLAVGAVIELATDAEGRFRLPAVAPGLYEVTAARTGFRTGRFDQVEVLLGQIKSLQFSLTVGGVSENVEVSAASPLIDARQSAHAASLRADQVEHLPRGTDYTSLLRVLPGVNAEPRLGGISMDGASAAENRFIIDGIDTTDAVLGLSTPTTTAAEQVAVLDVDNVEELQVKSSGYAAEYGGMTGGVVNVLTKSGTNSMRGDVRLHLGGAALDARPRRQLRRKLSVANEAEYVTYPEDAYSRYQPGFSIGGPIQPDAAWFFVSYQWNILQKKRTLTFTSDGSTGTFTQDIRQHLVTFSQTSRPVSNLHTRASFNASPARRDGVLPAQAGTEAPTSTFDSVDRLRIT